MKALVKDQPGEGLMLKEVPSPEVAPLDVLIKPIKTSICGTDLHIYKWDRWAAKTIKTPLTIGHEFVGMIVEIGSQVKHLKVGQRVTAEGHITCGTCRNCIQGKKHLCHNTIGLGIQRNGCFSEFFTVPAENVFSLPSFVSDSIASLFDPYGNAVHTALTFPLIGEDVLITGAGPIGIMGALIAKHAGARTVVLTDINEKRLALARKMAPIIDVNVAKDDLKEMMKKHGILSGFDVAMEMSGSPQALNQAIDTLAPGGKIALLGILPEHTQVDWDQIIFKMLTVKGIYGRKIFSTWIKMVSLLESGIILDPIVTHEFSYLDYEKAFQTMLKGDAGKVVLNWE